VVTSEPEISTQPEPRAIDALAMSRFKDRSEAVLYLWDYFYCANAPRPGDEKTWGRIERAMCRVRDDESELDSRHPVDLQLRRARRVRNAVRLALRSIEELSSQPERWVLEELAKLETFTTELVASLSRSPATVLH
jgi:hypothetical protein